MLQLTDFKSKTSYGKQEGSYLTLACQTNSVARFNDMVARSDIMIARSASLSTFVWGYYFYNAKIWYTIFSVIWFWDIMLE